MSSFFNPKFAKHNYLQVLTLFDSNGKALDKRLVYTNPKLLRLIRRIAVWAPYEWQTNDSLVDVSYKAYGTTTLYWLVGYYNGIIDPFEVTPGTTLKVPDAGSVEGVFNALLAKGATYNSTVQI